MSGTASPSPSPSSGRPASADARRLRDLLRSHILHGGHPDGRLPSEPELMRRHSASRTAVREALALLRDEGLVERLRGVGTHAVCHSVTTRLAEAHGVAAPDPRQARAHEVRVRVLDRSALPAPDAVAERLGVPVGSPCIRYEYLSLRDGRPVFVATNYALAPEGERLLGVPFRTDWYRLLGDAGLTVGQSEFLIGSGLADSTNAPLLGLEPGSPVMLLEQIIRDPEGRPWDLAFVVIRSDRFLFLSQEFAEFAQSAPLPTRRNP
ncbi:GntR family transcriptional regulator [Phaeacidiphilus oryzae]|uniref:GntR family transcriptional regulator n=1 Tax=Phaeacidiphilus oryzae TaxID=348818 RepID=UPI000A07A98E|nr:GntR family transcriptional regulator [Phaeacidiphilus oryzae]